MFFHFFLSPPVLLSISSLHVFPWCLGMCLFQACLMVLLCDVIREFEKQGSWMKVITN